MTSGTLPALANDEWKASSTRKFQNLIFHISKVGLVPTDIAYGNDIHCDQNPPNPSRRVVFWKKIFNLKALVVPLHEPVILFFVFSILLIDCTSTLMALTYL